MKRRLALVWWGLLMGLLSVDSIAASTDPILVSRTDSGSAANKASLYPALAQDGRYVAFSSLAANLVPGDSNNFYDVFVWDAQTNAVSRVSRGQGGEQANGNSYWPSISADGRFVAFYSSASNLVPGDNNGRWDIFVFDRQLQVTERVSRNVSGAAPNGDSLNPAISADGRFVAYSSSASDIVGDDRNNSFDVFVYDRLNKSSERISRPVSQGESNGASDWPSLSADGRLVSFQSSANNLTNGDANGQIDIFLVDRQANTLTNLTGAGNGPSYWPSISGDGSVVAFSSAASNMAANDTNNSYDIFVANLADGSIDIISYTTSGSAANSHSYWPRTDARGRYIAYTTLATNLSTDDGNTTWDVYLHELRTGGSQLISRSSASAGGNMSYWPAISPDGRYIGFASLVSDFAALDINNTWDIFVVDRGPLNRAPVAKAGSDIVLECQGSTTPATLDGRASYDPDGDGLTYTWRGIFGEVTGVAQTTVSVPYGSHYVELVVADPDGERSADGLVVTVADTTPPDLIVPGTISVEAASASGAHVDIDPVTTDRCGSVSLHVEPALAVFPIGNTLVNVTAMDEHSNSARIQSTVSVRDTTPPLLGFAPSVLIEAQGPLTSVDLPEPQADDAVGVVRKYHDGPAAFPVGTMTVNWYALDAAGNASSAVQTVTVVDTTPPRLSVPADIEIPAAGLLTDVELGQATAADLVDGVVQASPSSRGPFEVGQHVIEWRARDASGNEATAEQRLVVKNNLPSLRPLGDASIDEGGQIEFEVAFTDFDSRQWSVVVDFGDGASSRTDVTETGVLSFAHVYTDDGSFTVSIQIEDVNGGAAKETFRVEVANVAPRISSTQWSQGQIMEGEALALTAAALDPGSADSLDWRIDWGDGLVDTVSKPAGEFSLQLSHVYAKAGLYPVTITADDGDAEDSVTTEVAVVNIGEFIAVGGGRLSSSNDFFAKHVSPELNGRVGLRLMGPANAPTGQVSLYWRDEAGVRWKLKARQHDWMIIADQSLHVRGSGLLNRQTQVGYALHVTADDSGAQRLRWQVWNSETGAAIASGEQKLSRPGFVRWAEKEPGIDARGGKWGYGAEKISKRR